MSDSGIARLKTLLGCFDRVGMLRLPTPLEPMTRLSASLGGPRLWVGAKTARASGLGETSFASSIFCWPRRSPRAQTRSSPAATPVQQSSAGRRGRGEAGNAVPPGRLPRTGGAIRRRLPFQRQHAAEQAVRCAHLRRAVLRARCCRLCHRCVANPATYEAIAQAGRLEALPLDPVYSGKGLAGLIALIRGGRWRPDTTSSSFTPAASRPLFAYEAELSASLGG